MKRTVIVFLLAAMCLVPSAVHATELDDSLETIAKALSSAAVNAELKRLGVPEFTNAEGNLGGDTGTAGKLFAEMVEGFLINNSNFQFEVIERNRLNTVLAEGQYQASGLTAENTIEDLNGKIKGLDGLVLGSVTRVGSKVRVVCRLVNLGSGASIVAQQSAEFSLDADYLTLFGASVFVSTDLPVSDQRLVDLSQKPFVSSSNPFVSSDFRLEVITDGKSKPLYVHGSDVYVPGSRSEEYSLRVTNKTNARVGVAIFVDGLNLKLQKRQLASEAIKSGEYFVIDPNKSADFPGWQMTANTAKKFVFVAPSESVAARQHFTDSMGIISAAFYAENTGPSTGETPKGLGTGEGREVEAVITHVNFQPVQTPSAILTLRYENADIVKGYAPLTQ